MNTISTAPAAPRPGVHGHATTALLLCLGAASGCSTLPTASRFGEAAVTAASDPWVWAPLAGAAGLQVSDADRRISRWARRETPLFGSQSGATRWSDDLRSVAVVADAATVLLAPTDATGSDWVLTKGRDYAIDLVAATAAIETTHVLKGTAHRSRPSGVDDQSFPSGHATTAAVYDREAELRLASLDLGHGTQQALGYSLEAVTLGTAWARVDAGAHYPSDTLVGMAIGHFSARFFEAAFARPDGTPATRVFVSPTRGGLALNWSAAF